MSDQLLNEWLAVNYVRWEYLHFYPFWGPLKTAPIVGKIKQTDEQEAAGD